MPALMAVPGLPNILLEKYTSKVAWKVHHLYRQDIDGNADRELVDKGCPAEFEAPCNGKQLRPGAYQDEYCEHRLHVEWGDSPAARGYSEK